jgi:hypothetical protein
MKREIDISGIYFQNGLIFENMNGFNVTLMVSDDDAYHVFNFYSEKQFEKLTDKTIDSFDMIDFFWLLENYHQNGKINTDFGNNFLAFQRYDFSDWNEKLIFEKLTNDN